MDASIQKITPAWIEPLFVFLFFFNTFLLPEGLTFSLLLTPVWLYLLHRKGKLHLMHYITGAFLLYAVVHLLLGVVWPYYLVSTIMMLGIGIFTLTARYYLNTPAFDVDFIFKRIVLLNFCFTLISLPLLWIPVLKPVVWYIMSMSENVRIIARLKLFTSEASHYSYLIAPVFLYFYCKALFLKERPALPTLFMITLPMLLSLSFGVLSCLLLTGLLMALIYFNTLFDTRRKKMTLLLVVLAVAAVLIVLYRFLPDNLLFVRLSNMMTGKDTSARGRTYESFILANKIIAQKSGWWGIGPGQLKVIGRDIIVQYYFYASIPPVIRIPNACAETIICFGYIGFVIRMGVEIILFFLTKVYRNPYRLWLFLFLFLFQFMGSYITNTMEYIFWVLVYSPPVFQLFDRNPARVIK